MTEDPKSHEYWNGPKNKAIRYWFYVNRGMGLVDQFKNLVLCIAALYFALKLNNPLFLVGMFVVSLPIVGVAGYIQVHHLGKILDWLNIRFSTHYSIETFEIQKDIRDAVKEMAAQGRKNPG